MWRIRRKEFFVGVNVFLVSVFELKQAPWTSKILSCLTCLFLYYFVHVKLTERQVNYMGKQMSWYLLIKCHASLWKKTKQNNTMVTLVVITTIHLLKIKTKKSQLTNRIIFCQMDRMQNKKHREAYCAYLGHRCNMMCWYRSLGWRTRMPVHACCSDSSIRSIGTTPSW